jgi:hypothetical protein
MSRLALVLVFASLTACSAKASGSYSSSSGTMSPGTGSEGKPARPADAGSADGGAPGEAGAGAGGGTASSGPAAGPAACQPALADSPTALFGTRILIRLPKGLELVEQNPFYAQAASPKGATNCGQPISYAALGFFEYPANSAVQDVRNTLIEMRGLTAANVTWDDEGSRGRTYTAGYSAPADAATGAPAIRGWFVLRESNEKYAYFALYETDPAQWDAVKPVFVASGRSLLIKPRAPNTAPTPVAAGASSTGTTAPAASAGGLAAEPASSKKSAGTKKAK